MRDQYEPKPISFVPPILKRKFIAPDNPREMGTLVVLIGLAISIVSSWNNVSDVFKQMGKRHATGQFVAAVPFRSNNAARMVGAYIFKDEANIPVVVRGDRIYLNKAKVPKTVKVVWQSGLSYKAKTVGEYRDYLLGVPIGLAIIGFGLWIRRKKLDPYEDMLAQAEVNNGDKTS